MPFNSAAFLLSRGKLDKYSVIFCQVVPLRMLNVARDSLVTISPPTQTLMATLLVDTTLKEALSPGRSELTFELRVRLI